jgi:hypothetical protein
VNGICAALDADGVPPPAKGKNNWQRTFVRDCAFDDVYAPHTVEELEALGVSREALGKLDPAGLYGVWWYNRREAKTVRVPLGGGRYRKGKQIRKKPRHEWIPVPVPASREGGAPGEARRTLMPEESGAGGAKSAGAGFASSSYRVRRSSLATSKWRPRSWKRPTGTSVAQCTIPSESPSGPQGPGRTQSG